MQTDLKNFTDKFKNHLKNFFNVFYSIFHSKMCNNISKFLQYILNLKLTKKMMM